MGSVARIVTWLLLGTGLALVTTGCLATRDYVDERDNEIKSQLAALTTRVGAAEGRITQAQGKADQVEARSDVFAVGAVCSARSPDVRCTRRGARPNASSRR